MAVTLGINEIFLKKFTDDERGAIRTHVIFSLSIFALGAVIIVAAFMYGSSMAGEGLKTLLGVGGGFVGSLGAFPIVAIIKHKGKITAAESLYLGLCQLKDKSDPENLVERERIESLCRELIRKTLLE